MTLIMSTGRERSRGAVTMGPGLAAVAAAAAVEEVDLFRGLLGYLCGILLVQVGLHRTVVKGDGELGKKIWIEKL